LYATLAAGNSVSGSGNLVIGSSHTVNGVNNVAYGFNVTISADRSLAGGSSNVIQGGKQNNAILGGNLHALRGSNTVIAGGQVRDNLINSDVFA
jgi:hypothetical protein